VVFFGGVGENMKCPLCGKTDDRVIESRQSQSGATIRRRRECAECGYRFTSYEHIEEAPLTVIKKSGRREDFDLKKVKNGIQKALEKRPVVHSALEELLHVIKDEAIIMSRSTHEIRSENVGKLVLEKLLALDKVAYVRFASVYRQFEDVQEFIHEIDRLGPHASEQEVVPVETGENNELF